MCNNFIKYSRDLHNNPIFKSFSYQYRHIYLTIMIHAAYKTTMMNDHGKLIEVKPGQLLTTFRELVKLCDEEDIDRSKIERALTIFEKCQFSRQETRHKKTLITLTPPTSYIDNEINNETRNETKSRQDRDTKEEVKNLKKEKKETHVPTHEALRLANLLLFSIKKFKKDFKEPSNLNTWAKPIDQMMVLDQRKIEDIEVIINWLPTSDFWRKNILSGDKLRTQFDKLQIQKETDLKKKEFNEDFNNISTNKNFYLEAKKHNPDLFKHLRMSGDFLIIDQNKELHFKMKPDAFQAQFLKVCGVTHA